MTSLRILTCALVLLTTKAAWADELPWSAANEHVAADLGAGAPLVLHVVVPLCDSRQIACGKGGAGNPRDLDRNLYWGAIFGARRFFDRKRSGFERVSSTREIEGVLERVVYRRWYDGAKWGRAERVEQIVVLDAVERIGAAVDGFWSGMKEGETIPIRDGERERSLRVHAVGYVGHNWGYEGIGTGQEKRRETSNADALPSFILSCVSERYFAAGLENEGSSALLLTRDFIAPEGYALEALVRALGENATRTQARHRVIAAYAKWQRIPVATAARLFSRVPTATRTR
jgi:hypothetical protein